MDLDPIVVARDIAPSVQGSTYTFRWSYDVARYGKKKSVRLHFEMNGSTYSINIMDASGNTMAGPNTVVKKKMPSQRYSVDIYLGNVNHFGPNVDSGTFKVKFKGIEGSNRHYYNIQVIIEVEDGDPIIPQTPSLTIVDVGDTQTATLTNASELVSHKIKWQYTGYNTTQETTEEITTGEMTISDPAQRIVYWAVPSDKVESIYWANRNTDTVEGEFWVKTYLENELVKENEQDDGERSVTAFLTIPQTVKPSATIAAQVNGSEVDENTKIIQNKTEVTLVVQHDGICGQTITKVEVEATDFHEIQTYANNVDPKQTTFTFTPQTHTSSSLPYNISVVVTDSRGHTDTKTMTISVWPQQRAGFVSARAYRCKRYTSNNNEYVYVEDDEGTYLKIEALAKPSVGDVSILYSAQVEGPNPVQFPGLSNPQTDGCTSIITDHEFSADEEFYVVVTALPSDSSSDPTAAAQIRLHIGTAVYTIYRMAGGHGVAFGGPATQYGVEVNPNWPLYTHGREIMELLVDTAHPVGSIIETLEQDFDPNSRWPWTHWDLFEDHILRGTGSSVLFDGDNISTSSGAVPYLCVNMWMRVY